MPVQGRAIWTHRGADQVGLDDGIDHFDQVLGVGVHEGPLLPEGLFAGRRPHRKISHPRQFGKLNRRQAPQADNKRVEEGAENPRALSLERRQQFPVRSALLF